MVETQSLEGGLEEWLVPTRQPRDTGFRSINKHFHLEIRGGRFSSCRAYQVEREKPSQETGSLIPSNLTEQSSAPIIVVVAQDLDLALTRAVEDFSRDHTAPGSNRHLTLQPRAQREKGIKRF